MTREEAEREVNAARFPSGRWVGFRICTTHGKGVKDRLELLLEFAEGRIRGSGRTSRHTVLGIEGTYDADLLECWLRLRFPEAGDIDDCRGFREGRGIWGTWRCPVGGCTGGFQIWPSRRGENAALDASAQAPADAASPSFGCRRSQQSGHRHNSCQ